MEMKELLLQLITVSTLLVLSASIQAPVHHVFLENELTLDLAAGSSDEWIITTEPNHVFYFSFLTDDDVDDQLISSSITIMDAAKPDSLLFPSDINQLSPFYSTDNAVSIKFKSSSSLKPFRLRAEKAVACPFNIGGSTSCGRVVDELSCYCGLFTANLGKTKAYCKSYNMSFLSVESYEEDLAVFTAFAGLTTLWIGLSDTASEANFIWDSTGKKLSPGYMGFAPGYPLSSCANDTSDCVAYDVSNGLPAWKDISCTSNYGGICELQPSNSSGSTQPVELPLKEELIFDLSGSPDEWIITTDSNHIFYFSFIIPDSITEQQKEELLSSLTIVGVNSPDSLLFPSINHINSFYSTDNVVSIRYKPSYLNDMMKGIRLRAEKAVPCPFNLGGASSCGRVVDELSCYCGLFLGRSWSDTRDFCKANNMSFVTIETYEEDLALLTAFGDNDYLWLGASDTTSEGTYVWDSTGKPMSPGYQGWGPGGPVSDCRGSSYDCLVYSRSYTTLPAWYEGVCTTLLGGICELQPSNSSSIGLYLH